MGLTAFGGNHDHRDAFGVGHSGKLFYELEAVHDGHIDIAENQVDGVILKDDERLSSISRLEYLFEIDPGLAQASFHNFSHDRGVVNNQGTNAIHKAKLIFSN